MSKYLFEFLFKESIQKQKEKLTSFPPTALVKITAEDTGGGMQPTVCKLKTTKTNVTFLTRQTLCNLKP